MWECTSEQQPEEGNGWRDLTQITELPQKPNKVAMGESVYRHLLKFSFSKLTSSDKFLTHLIENSIHQKIKEMNYLGNDYSGPNSNQQRIDSLSERNRNPERKQFGGLKFHYSPGDGDWILPLCTIGHLQIHISVPKTITDDSEEHFLLAFPQL